MKYIAILLTAVFLTVGCSAYEKENKSLKEELRQVREEDNYLKAQIVGLNKEVEELRSKLKEEREGMAKRIQEEVQAVRKAQEEQNSRKKASDAKPTKKKSQ
jgi:predicted  nucleic acid-binding Zn-ribbon protein